MGVAAEEDLQRGSTTCALHALLLTSMNVPPRWRMSHPPPTQLPQQQQQQQQRLVPCLGTPALRASLPMQRMRRVRRVPPLLLLLLLEQPPRMMRPCLRVGMEVLEDHQHQLRLLHGPHQQQSGSSSSSSSCRGQLQ